MGSAGSAGGTGACVARGRGSGVPGRKVDALGLDHDGAVPRGDAGAGCFTDPASGSRAVGAGAGAGTGTCAEIDGPGAATEVEGAVVSSALVDAARTPELEALGLGSTRSTAMSATGASTASTARRVIMSRRIRRAEARDGAFRSSAPDRATGAARPVRCDAREVVESKLAALAELAPLAVGSGASAAKSFGRVGTRRGSMPAASRASSGFPSIRFVFSSATASSLSRAASVSSGTKSLRSSWFMVTARSNRRRRVWVAPGVKPRIAAGSAQARARASRCALEPGPWRAVAPSRSLRAR